MNLISGMLDTVAAYMTRRRHQRMAIEQCRIRYGIQINRIKADRDWEDAAARAQRQEEDWNMQAEHDREIETILAARPAAVRDINDVRFK